MSIALFFETLYFCNGKRRSFSLSQMSRKTIFSSAMARKGFMKQKHFRKANVDFRNYSKDTEIKAKNKI